MPRHPIELTPTTANDAIAALEARTAHVALVRLPVDTERFSAIPLYDESAVVVAAREHPIAAFDTLTLADLAGELLVDGDWADSVSIAATGAGIAVLPQPVARALSRRDVIAREVTDAPQTRMALVWPIGDTSSDVEEFIGIVRGRTANSSRGSGRGR
jgi:DNA-binding transcriptional LysR family regulator